LTWDYTWWNRGAPWLIFLFGYLTFFVVAFWVFDMKTFKQKMITVGTIWGAAIVSLVVFIGLGWI
jgi:vacuolar-type H+-ATPase subunit I/STV1